MSFGRSFQGRQTQFYIELLYGALFIAGFGFLVFRTDPRVAAFEGGLVVGYLLRIWEKMSIYERILQEAVSEAADALGESTSSYSPAPLASNQLCLDYGVAYGGALVAYRHDKGAALSTDRLLLS